MKTIKLNKPVKYGEKEIKELSFKEPTCGDLKGINLGRLAEGDAGEVLKLAFNIQAPVGDPLVGDQKLPQGFFEELPIAEFSKIAGVIGEFLGE